MLENQRFVAPKMGEEFPSEYDMPSPMLQDLVSRGIAPIVTTTLDLSTAGSKTLVVPGRAFVPFFFATNTANKVRNPSGQLQVSINSDGSDSLLNFPAKHNRGYRGFFITLTLSWPAQVNTSVDFVIYRSKRNPWMSDDLSGSIPPLNDGNSGAAATLDFSGSDNHALTLTANATLTFQGAKAGNTYLVKLTQDGTGGRTVTWPASVKWKGGTPPTLTAAAGGVDIMVFYYDGTNFYGVPGLAFA